MQTFLFAQSDAVRTIGLLQDDRRNAANEFSEYLRSNNPRDREKALFALANIQDTGSVDIVAPLLSDESPKVRSMAAFALGMISKPRCATFLFRRLAVEREEKCIAEILNAIGMCGSQDDLKKMIAQSEDYPAEWRSWVASSIGRFANRKVRDISASRFAASQLYDNSTVINATYALMRINDTTVIRNSRTRLIEQLSNNSSIVRMWTAAVLTALDDEETGEALMKIAVTDKDWRVRVNALRALRNRPSARKTVWESVSNKNEHVALTAVSTYEFITRDDRDLIDSTIIISLIRSSSVPVGVREELLILLAKRQGEKALPMIGRWEGNQPAVTAQRMRAYGATRSEKAIPFLKEALQHPVPSSVTIAALEAYQAIARSSTETVKKDFLKTAVLMFAKKDAGISYTSALAFQDSSFSMEMRAIYRSALNAAYNTMSSPNDLEPMVELLKVFEQIGDSTSRASIEAGLRERDHVIRQAAGKAYQAIMGEYPPAQEEIESVPFRPFYSMSDLPLLEQYQGAVITTTKGKIKITFERESAPFTVLNFIKLSQKKFYDGLSFHRVVNNFVIQGGDPLGNGSGGPGYAIRTEVHPNSRFKSGAVGMASAGKDTEGSQWFITHCPTPHLDFRYTVFGYTPDAKIVDQIMIGDTIESIILF